MADLIDQAQAHEELHRAQALAARPRPQPGGASAYACGSCGERIPEERRAAVRGCQLCAFCAGQLDKRGR